MADASLITFAGLIFVASCTPGPNVLATVTNALSFGMRGAGLAVIGNLAALLMVAAAAAFGVGSLARLFPDAFTIVKLAGAAYLIYVGIAAIRASFAANLPQPEEAQTPASGIILRTMLISLSNPKSVLFLSAAFPAFIDPGRSILPQFAAMFAVLVAVVGLVHTGYALLALRVRGQLLTEAGRRWTGRVAGISFAGIGLGMAVEAIRHR